MGVLLRDRYEPLEVVGRGGEGEVMRALDRLHDRQVAIKVRLLRTAADRTAALSEARILLGLHAHPQLPVVREDFFLDDRYCIVMDWVEGTNLAQRAEQAGGRLPLAEVLGHLAQVAAALDHLHRQDPPVVHGDVKPENILLAATGFTVLVDFGVARRDSASTVVAGTRGFAAPELALGQPATPAADIFSLAATAFALLTGEPPRPGVVLPWHTIAGERARQVELALRRGLTIDPARRPSRASDLIRAMAIEDGKPTNLPAEVSSFVGRQRLLADVVGTLGDDRLLTLVGPGGIGKSRLARQAAVDVLDEVPDGVWLVELAPLTDPALLPSQILTAMGVTLDACRVVAEALISYLAERRVVLVLDNCEHIRDGVASLAAQLLEACAHVRILATSRQPLGLPTERVIAVPPLEVPSASDASVEALAQYEAARLVVERVARVRPDFAVGPEEAPALTQLCRRLDGIPLALELAAARLGTLSLAEVTQGLDDRFRLLRGTRSDSVTGRHDTMRAAVEWSYDTLALPERRVFDRLSVFAGGIEPAAAEKVASGAWIDPGDVASILAALADRSLLVPEDTPQGLRYGMLETLRQFAAERLRAAGDEARVHTRHLSWTEALVAEAGAHAHRADAAPWLVLLETELDNIREALRWGSDHDADGALRVLVRLGWFWACRNRQTEGRRWWDVLLAKKPDAPQELVASGLMQAANLADHQSDHAVARALFQQALEAYTALGDQARVGQVLSHLAYSAQVTGDREAARRGLDEAIAVLRPLGPSQHLALAVARRARLSVSEDAGVARAGYEEALTMYEATGHEFGRLQTLLNLGLLSLFEGDIDRGETLIAETLGPDHEGLQFGKIRMAALCGLARVAYERGDFTRAQALYEKVLAEASEAGLPAEIGFARQGLAAVALVQGDTHAARSHLEQALTSTAGADPSWIEDLAAVAVEEGEHREAAELLGRARARRDAIGEPVQPLDVRRVKRTTATARALLGDQAFSRAWERGGLSQPGRSD